LGKNGEMTKKKKEEKNPIQPPETAFGHKSITHKQEFGMGRKGTFSFFVVRMAVTLASSS